MRYCSEWLNRPFLLHGEATHVTTVVRCEPYLVQMAVVAILFVEIRRTLQ